MVTLLKDYEQQTYFLNSSDDINGIVFHNGDMVFLMDQDRFLIYDQENDNWQPMLPLMPMYFNAVTGAYYPRILRQDLAEYESASAYGVRRWYKCTHMTEAYVGGLVATATAPGYTFAYCTGLIKLELPDIANVPNNFASYCPALEQIILGAVNKPITGIGANAFAGCTQSGLTITVYVTPGTQPLSNSPWGATNATIIYRSSVTGDIIT